MYHHTKKQSIKIISFYIISQFNTYTKRIKKYEQIIDVMINICYMKCILMNKNTEVLVAEYNDVLKVFTYMK